MSVRVVRAARHPAAVPAAPADHRSADRRARRTGVEHRRCDGRHGGRRRRGPRVVRGAPTCPRSRSPPHRPTGWLSRYHYRGGQLPADALRVLTNHEGAGFASVVEDGVTLAIARATVDERWLCVQAVEVDASARRRGLGRHVMRRRPAVGPGRRRPPRPPPGRWRPTRPAHALYDGLGFSAAPPVPLLLALPASAVTAASREQFAALVRTPPVDLGPGRAPGRRRDRARPRPRRRRGGPRRAGGRRARRRGG